MVTVSIGVPVYNGERFIGKALECLTAQTYKDLEIIVSDNASSDRTPEIVKSFMDRDPRVKYHRNPVNIGAQPNYNRTFDFASGKYLKWHACDDLIAPTYIEKCVALLEGDPSAVLAHAETGLVDDDGDLLILDPKSGEYAHKSGSFAVPPADQHFADSQDPVIRFREALTRTATCQHIMALMRADAARATGLLDTYYSADRAFLVEMALRGRFRIVPEMLFFKREHSGNSRAIKSSKAKSAWSGAPAWMGQFDFLHGYFNMTRGLLRTNLPFGAVASCLTFAVLKAVGSKLGLPKTPKYEDYSRVPGLTRLD